MTLLLASKDKINSFSDLQLSEIWLQDCVEELVVKVLGAWREQWSLWAGGLRKVS